MWKKALKVSEASKNSARTVDLGSCKAALFNVGGKFYALANECLHRGGPLGEGHLDGQTVTCPWHAWEFDVKTGDCPTMKGVKQVSYPVKVEDGFVFIDVPA